MIQNFNEEWRDINLIRYILFYSNPNLLIKIEFTWAVIDGFHWQLTGTNESKLWITFIFSFHRRPVKTLKIKMIQSFESIEIFPSVHETCYLKTQVQRGSYWKEGVTSLGLSSRPIDSKVKGFKSRLKQDFFKMETLKLDKLQNNLVQKIDRI